MNRYNFFRTSLVVTDVKIANIDYNKKQIIESIRNAYNNSCSLVVFPELSLTSYTCSDLFLTSELLDKSIDALIDIAEMTKGLNILSIIGAPIRNNSKLFNCAVVISNGKIIGIVPKTYIPNYKEFYEKRWFSESDNNYYKTLKINSEDIPFGTDLIFEHINNSEIKIGIEICEDIWMPVPPSSKLALAGANIICNLSASNALVGKSEYRRELVKSQSGRCICAYLYVSSGTGESTTDLVFDGDAFAVENGVIIAESERFKRETQSIIADIDIEKINNERIRITSFENSKEEFRKIYFSSDNKEFELTRFIDPHPFVPKESAQLEKRCLEIFNIQASGLAKRFESLPKDYKAVIGVSGGLDSTLVLLVILKSFKIIGKTKDNLIAVTMPGFGTSDRTYNNITSLFSNLNIKLEDISIKDISELMLKKLNSDNTEHNVTYENIQARARTYLLMSIANKEGGIVVGTGDLSESALGWSTYNGDHMSMYNVNAGVPKTLVKFLVKWIAENEYSGNLRDVLLDIVNQPISPELIPAKNNEISQKTEDIIGPYELHDFFLYNFVRWGFSFKKIFYLAKLSFKDIYNEETIKKWLTIFIKRFFANQWKRDCVPAGPKVGTIDLSPRGSWRMSADSDIQNFII